MKRIIELSIEALRQALKHEFLGGKRDNGTHRGLRVDQQFGFFLKSSWKAHPNYSGHDGG